MCTWFSAAGRCFRYDRKCLFSCIYNPQITISPTSLFSMNFNENHIKNHPKPWTCPLSHKLIVWNPSPQNYQLINVGLGRLQRSIGCNRADTFHRLLEWHSGVTSRWPSLSRGTTPQHHTKTAQSKYSLLLSVDRKLPFPWSRGQNWPRCRGCHMSELHGYQLVLQKLMLFMLWLEHAIPA